MTDTQIKFIKTIYTQEGSAKDICKRMKIKPSDSNDPIGGYHNSLNEKIGYLQSDEESEIEKYFTITQDHSCYADNDIYSITEAGKVFYETMKTKRSEKKRENWKWLITLLVAIIAIVVSILCRVL